MSPPPDRPVPLEELLADASWLRALASRLMHDSASADDLVQGAMAAAVERPPSLDRPLRPWLAGLVRNLARSQRRDDGRRERRERLSARAEAVAPPDEILAQFDEQRKLARVVAQLDPIYRTVILRRFWRGESCAQIARATGTKPVTVRARLSRGLTRLRESFEREHGGDRARSLLSLEIAVGKGAGLAGTIAPTLVSIVAMKTAATLATASLLVALVLFGLRAAQDDDPVSPEAPALVLAPEVQLVDDSEARASAADPDRFATPGRSVVAAEATIPTTETLESMAAPRTALALRAIDGRGRPIRGARLRFARRDGALRDAPASEASDGDGRVVLDVPHAMTFRDLRTDVRLTTLRLEASGFAALYLVGAVTAGVVEDLGDRRLEPGADVAGHVLDAAGFPVPGVNVVAVAVRAGGQPMAVSHAGGFRGGPTPGELFPRTVTDSNGAFHLDGLTPGKTELSFQRPGHPWDKSEPFDFEAGATYPNVELVLAAVDPDDVIVGRVVRPDGSFATGACVRWRNAERFFTEEAIPVGEGGLFTLVPGAKGEVVLIAFDPSSEFGPSVIQRAAPGEPPLELRLTEARYLKVVVKDTSGNPLERAWLLPLVDGKGTGRGFEYTDADGLISVLAPATTFVQRVGRRGYVLQELGPIEPHELPMELVVELEREPEIRGIVRADGVVVEGADVSLVRSAFGNGLGFYQGFASRYESMPHSRSKSEADGSFRTTLDDPGEHTWAVLVTKEGYALTEHVIGRIVDVAEVEELAIDLTRGGAIEGEVTVGPTRSREGIVIACSREDGWPHVTRTDPLGRYRFDHLTPGPWVVEDRQGEPARRGGGVVYREDHPFVPNVHVQEGETSPLDLDLRWQDGLTVQGRLTIGGRPAQGFSAVLEEARSTDPGSAPVLLDEDGRFECAASPGENWLVLSLKEREIDWRIMLPVVVDPYTAPLAIDIPTAVLQSSGCQPNQPIRVRHSLENDGEITVDFTADGNGAFSGKHVPAGRLRVLQMVTDETYGDVFVILSEPTVAVDENHIVTSDEDG